MPDVTILVVNYNTRKFIELCLKSIALNTIMSHRVVVIDNGSTDKSLRYLKNLGRARKILLYQRSAPFGASEHGRAFDDVLYRTRLVNTPLVCTIDSDAYVAKKGWLTELNKQRKGNFAVGYEHFRDPHCLHPACMLMDYQTLIRIGRPSFALTKEGNIFYDTGIKVSEVARAKGAKLVGARGLEAMVPHRWCATRIQHAKFADSSIKLDGRITKNEFSAENNIWFSRPDVAKIMSIKYT